MGVRAALALGLTLVAIGVAVVMSGSPVRIVGTSSAAMRTRIGFLQGRSGACQDGEALPKGTTAIRVALEAVVGPRVSVTALSGGRVLARGAHGSGWTGADVTVPVGYLARPATNAIVCVAVGQSREVIAMIGQRSGAPSAATSAGGPLAGRMRIEYLGAGDRSWWSMVLPVARRIGLGRAPGGTWVVLLQALLMAAITTLASWLCLRELRTRSRKGDRAERTPGAQSGFLALARRVPVAAWACALIACLNAVCWSLLSPPFQVPDEPSHFAYVQQLAEAQRLPVGGSDEFSPEEEVALEDLHQSFVAFLPSAHTISSRAQQQKLERDLARALPGTGPGDAGTAASEPPLYYVLETIPYELGSGGTLLDRLELMRLLSALFGGLTALFAFLFVREALPRVRWAWTVGGLGVALAPLLAFMSGAVNPDALLFAVSAALFYLLARAFRRGLTRGLAVAIGAVVAAGLITKLNFLGLVPGAILGLVVVSFRGPAEDRHTSYLALALAVALAASPVLVYLALEPLLGHASPGLPSSTSATLAGRSVLSEASYIWQLYLPRLPDMSDYFPGIFTSRQLWFDGLVGLYGWADTAFPGWVYDIALVPAGLIALLCTRALVVGRAALGQRAGELLVYAAMGVGVMALVGAGSYVNDVGANLGPFAEPRYLLPMLPLLGAVLVLAARGAGRRWGPVAGTLIVVLILAHDLFSQLLVISRYFG